LRIALYGLIAAGIGIYLAYQNLREYESLS
jgi:hypothetical protein